MIDKRLMQEGKKVSRYLIATIILGIASTLLAVAQAWLVAQVIAQVFLHGATLSQVKTLLLRLLGIIIARGILQVFSEMSAQEAALRLKEDLRERFLTQLLSLGPLYTRGERAGELMNTAVEGIEALEDYFSRYIPQLIFAVVLPSLVLGFVFPLDYKSGVILLLTGPLIPLFMMLIGKLAEKKSLRQWQSLSRMSAHFLEMLQGLPTLKVFGRSFDQARVIGRVSEAFREATMGVLRIAFLSALVLEFLATISTALIAVALGLRLINRTISFADSLFLLLLAPEFYLPLRNLGNQFHARLSGVSAADRIYAILDFEKQVIPSKQKNEETNNLEGRYVKDAIQNSKKDFEKELIQAGRNFTHLEKDSILEKERIVISLERVSLRYDSGSEKVLTDVSFQVCPGEKIALVGPSGVGKSSILNLFLRFLDPTDGEIMVNGISLKEIPRTQWWSQLAYIPQKPYLFAGTILDNLRIGRENATLEEIIESAKKARAHDFILSFPQGYDTVIGERGARLSGGQVQRLAIARAFLKGAPLLLMDEPTSSLDTESEEEVLAALEELSKERTVIFASHRLRTVEKADKILVLDQGILREQGSHGELMEKQGLYAQFVQEYWGEA